MNELSGKSITSDGEQSRFRGSSLALVSIKRCGMRRACRAS